jgi:hypothetical protein
VNRSRDRIRGSLWTAACVTALLGCADPGRAREAAKPPLKMFQLEQASAGRSTIDGGSRQDEGDWPATLKYTADGRFTCTSTIVGQRAVITAAHCLDDGTTAEVQLPKDRQTITIRCEHHPRFNRRQLINDLAFCFSDNDFPPRFGYENIDTHVTRIRRNTSLFLLGYGCRDVDDIGNPDKLGQLYGGFAPVGVLPTAANDHVETKGGLVICRGDSGGAAYVLAARDELSGPRSIVGINSGYFPKQRVSAITPFNGASTEFIHAWTADKKVFICGFHPQAINCRDRFVP